MSLHLLLDHLSKWGIVIFIRDSKYGMPAVQSLHLLGLTVLLATVLVLNLRLSGFGRKDLPLSSLARLLNSWTIGAVTIVILSGVLIFLTRTEGYLGSRPFRIKMALLALAILFHYTVIRRRAVADAGSRSRAADLALAAVSLTLWFGVGWAGRAIAFIP